MELFNHLPDERLQAVEDFLTFIPIYNSKRRTSSLLSLLKRHQSTIQNGVVCEAGAARGLFSEAMRDMGAQKVYAVERSEILFEILQSRLGNEPRIECVEEDIQDFEPQEKIDLLFHEFYGPLVLDETMLALQDLAFEPGTILPDGGRLWAMPLSEKEILERDPLYEPHWKHSLSGALISEMFDWVKFEKKWCVFDWNLSQENPSFTFELPEACDFLVLCGEITHQGKSVLNMWWTHNWPLIFTPVSGTKFSLDFEYEDGFTEVFFQWMDGPEAPGTNQ